MTNGLCWLIKRQSLGHRLWRRLRIKGRKPMQECRRKWRSSGTRPPLKGEYQCGTEWREHMKDASPEHASLFGPKERKDLGYQFVQYAISFIIVFARAPIYESQPKLSIVFWTSSGPIQAASSATTPLSDLGSETSCSSQLTKSWSMLVPSSFLRRCSSGAYLQFDNPLPYLHFPVIKIYLFSYFI